jgi:hypothetical protein
MANDADNKDESSFSSSTGANSVDLMLRYFRHHSLYMNEGIFFPYHTAKFLIVQEFFPVSSFASAETERSCLQAAFACLLAAPLSGVVKTRTSLKTSESADGDGEGFVRR